MRSTGGGGGQAFGEVDDNVTLAEFKDWVRARNGSSDPAGR
jgi:hypothetical protein